MKPKLYIKSLGYNVDNNLVSCHGGTQVWEFRNPRSDLPEGQPRTVHVDADPVVTKGSVPCAAGTLHALRVRDLPYWLGTAYAIVEMPDAKAHGDKVYGTSQRIVRIADFDALQMLVDFAQYCADKGAEYTDADGAKWIAARFPAGFLDGVEE